MALRNNFNNVLAITAKHCQSGLLIRSNFLTFATTTNRQVASDGGRCLSSLANRHNHCHHSTQNTLFATNHHRQLQIINNRWRSNLITQKRRSLQVTITELPEKFNMEWPKITLFGDSITRRSTDVNNGCWGSMIEYRVGNYFDVDPRGLEGYNTKWALGAMPKLFPRTYLDKVELFIIFLGANDSWEDDMPMHLPPEKYEENLREIIRYLVRNGLEKRKIILITPGFFHMESFHQLHIETDLPLTKKELVDLKKYVGAVQRIGNDEGIDVVDFFGHTEHYEPLVDLFCDGVHFSRIGAEKLFEILFPVVKRKIEFTFKKPLEDLWHIIPFDQHPEFKPIISAWRRGKAATRR